MTAPPDLDLESYGPRLGDTTYWLPYAHAALDCAGLPREPLVSGFAGTYPTLIGPSLVVKLFGVFPGWLASFGVERAVNWSVNAAEIAAPRLLAHGSLYPNRDDEWPFLVFETVPGVAWRETSRAERSTSVAAALGRQLRCVHALTPPPMAVQEGAWWEHAAAGVTGRWRDRGTLPPRLLDQVADFVAAYEPAPGRLVHADVTQDHVFVQDGGLAGLIDWGDAMVCDPHYDLAALHASAFSGRRDLLGAFLDAYGWDLRPDFPQHCLRVALLHRFDVLADLTDQIAAATTLDELAERAWMPVAPSHS